MMLYITRLKMPSARLALMFVLLLVLTLLVAKLWRTSRKAEQHHRPLIWDVSTEKAREQLFSDVQARFSGRTIISQPRLVLKLSNENELECANVRWVYVDTHLGRIDAVEVSMEPTALQAAVLEVARIGRLLRLDVSDLTEWYSEQSVAQAFTQYVKSQGNNEQREVTINNSFDDQLPCFCSVAVCWYKVVAPPFTSTTSSSPHELAKRWVESRRKGRG